MAGALDEIKFKEESVLINAVPVVKSMLNPMPCLYMFRPSGYWGLWNA